MDSGRVLILGGARSGKSRYGERLAEESGLEPVYLATGEPGDEEMAARIAAHRARRCGAWRTVEEPLELEAALAREAASGRALLVDCLTLWLSNLMAAGAALEARIAALAAAAARLPGLVVFVSNEVGLGLVPETPLGRAFRDAQGRLNQAMAEACDRLVLMVAGLPLMLKGEAP
jgi:adenosylcobinamide kinase / adenosylcobinamide-phosphate guanylyltransferase